MIFIFLFLNLGLEQIICFYSVVDFNKNCGSGWRSTGSGIDPREKTGSRSALEFKLLLLNHNFDQKRHAEGIPNIYCKFILRVILDPGVHAKTGSESTPSDELDPSFLKHMVSDPCIFLPNL